MPLLQKAYLGATPLFAEKPWFYNAEMELVNSAGVTGTQGTIVTASATTHTKGAWAQLIASTSAETTLVSINVGALGFNATETSALIDIGTGASGSESVLIGDVAVGSAASQSGGGGISIVVPVKIPSGTRISARIQAATASDQARVSIVCWSVGDGTSIPTSVDVVGGDTATSRGTALAASNAWTQVIASTSDDYAAFCLVPSSSATVASSSALAYEIGVGASGSEQTFGVIPWLVMSNSEQLTQNMIYPLNFFAKDVPAGSRISVRQSSAESFFEATVIGIPKP
jgi:hypothetical protein